MRGRWDFYCKSSCHIEGCDRSWGQAIGVMVKPMGLHFGRGRVITDESICAEAPAASPPLLRSPGHSEH
jgi:hypothetical protein